jgi:predicted dehydrogenase
VAWDSPWMLDPEASGGGALRNLGTHGFDLFHALTGEEMEVIGAQISARALGEKVEDYASVLFSSESGVLGTLEVGNAFPRLTTEGIKIGGTDKLLDGADGEMKICGSATMLSAKDGKMKLVSARNEEVMPGLPDGNPSYRILEDALSRWKSGQAPAVSVFDCLRAVKLVDDAYRLAGAKK